jgi:4-diphosphocytidyl-2-C-methyl-D-erythritol kinase
MFGCHRGEPDVSGFHAGTRAATRSESERAGLKSAMVSIPSFAKINLGLKIGPARPDGFHELRTIYQTLAIHDVVRVEAATGSGIEIRCEDGRVPRDASNTCHKIAERVLNAAGIRSKVVVEIEKNLPVQGGLGAASSNAVAAMLAMERALGVELPRADKLRIAAEVGSDLPLFLFGGTVLGLGRGEEVYPFPDLPPTDVVVVIPAIGVSTPKAFAQWDELAALDGALTTSGGAGRIWKVSSSLYSLGLRRHGTYKFLDKSFPQALAEAGLVSGVPAWSGDRAETPLLDLVRAGIENDFERVVFPEHPELREVKELLLREGAQYASLSGSGSTLYGLFASEAGAKSAAERMTAAGHKATATKTLTRAEYWQALVSG